LGILKKLPEKRVRRNSFGSVGTLLHPRDVTGGKRVSAAVKWKKKKVEGLRTGQGEAVSGGLDYTTFLT
jgi:hypothetical protein